MYWPIFVYLTQKSKEYIIKEDHMMLIYQFSINIGTFLISKILYILARDITCWKCNQRVGEIIDVCSEIVKHFRINSKAKNNTNRSHEFTYIKKEIQIICAVSNIYNEIWSSIQNAEDTFFTHKWNEKKIIYLPDNIPTAT